MIARDALPLGEFYILTNAFKNEKDIIEAIVDQTKAPNSSAKSTMVVCMYNIYLTSSNLVFQPNTRRMRIRPLIDEDVFNCNSKKGQLQNKMVNSLTFFFKRLNC